jgi:hypothetical protein
MHNNIWPVIWENSYIPLCNVPGSALQRFQYTPHNSDPSTAHQAQRARRDICAMRVGRWGH